MSLKRVADFRVWSRRCTPAQCSDLFQSPRIQQTQRLFHLSSRRCMQISSTSPAVEPIETPDRIVTNTQIIPNHTSPNSTSSTKIVSTFRGYSPRYEIHRAPTTPSNSTASSNSSSGATTDATAPRPPLKLTQTLIDNIPFLISQPPFYATIHIHGKPYLVTPGDTVRLPFLMHGVFPGDTLRLDRASLLGSRDWTLQAGESTSQATAGHEEPGDEATITEPIIGKTEGLEHRAVGTGAGALHFRAKKNSKFSYLDDRLFEIRATVLGTENEPMRIKEKTKRRQRHVKHVKSKLRYTILKISEVKIKNVDELLAQEEEKKVTSTPGTTPGASSELESLS